MILKNDVLNGTVFVLVSFIVNLFFVPFLNLLGDVDNNVTQWMLSIDLKPFNNTKYDIIVLTYRDITLAKIANDFPNPRP